MNEWRTSEFLVSIYGGSGGGNDDKCASQIGRAFRITELALCNDLIGIDIVSGYLNSFVVHSFVWGHQRS